MKKVITLVLALLSLVSLCACYATDTDDSIPQTTDNSEENTYTDIQICSKIELSYFGNKDNSITIEDEGVCSDLMAFISKADGTKEESSKGYYGAPYNLTIYFDGEEAPLEFVVWDKMLYSTSEHKDDEGYHYLFSDDLSDMWQYLEEKYPDEFWYPEIVVGDQLLVDGNVVELDVFSLSEEYNYSFTGEDAQAIVDYLSELRLEGRFEEKPDEYDGMTWVISLEYENGDTLKIYHFGNMFIRSQNSSWYKMTYEEASYFEILLEQLNSPR